MGHAQPPRFTAATPEETVKLALARGRAGGKDALAGLAVARSLAYRVTPRLVERALSEIGGSDSALGLQARWLAASLGPRPVAPRGLIKQWAIVGPFRDTGGGLLRKEGPEGDGQRWGDPRADYSWGSFAVRWRALPTEQSTALGVPLELVLHPRQESCSYLATRVSLQAAATVRIYVAAAGAVRLLWDGSEAARSEEVHPGMVFDRLAAAVSSPAGEHLLALKICSSALADNGRVRVHLTDATGHDLDVVASSDLRPLPPRFAAGPAAQPVVTLLGEGLRGDGVAAERSLLGAVLRTLGSADDLRAQRAPGLLFDAAAAATTPDELAFAAYLSTFGANRSGWLNLALGRARASGDTATASFALRNLAAARSHDGFPDWAMAALDSEPLATQTDLDARLLRDDVQLSSRITAVQRSAVARLAERAQADPAATPVMMWNELLEAAGEFDPNLSVMACERLTSLTMAGIASRCLATLATRDAATLRSAAREVLAAGALSTVTDFLLVSRALANAGFLDDAQGVVRQLSELAPNRAEVWFTLSRLLYQTGRAADLPVAAQALAHAYELEPTSTTLRAALNLRAGPKPEVDPSADAALLVEPAVFLGRRNPPAVIGQVARRTLHSMRVLVVHPDRRISDLTHEAYEVVIEPRGQNELVDYVAGNELLRARVHHPDGSVALPREQVAQRQSTKLRWPELHTGDVVEVAYRSWTPGPVGGRYDAPYHFAANAGSLNTHPLLHTEVIVISPQDHPLAVDVINGKADRQSVTVVGKNQQLHFIWDHPPTVPEEPLAPALTELVPVVIGSSFGGWSEFRTWYQNAVAGFTEPDAQIQKLAAQLTAGKTTREDKLRALFNYVADSIRYVNYLSAEAWLPNRPQQLLARKQGDCDDKAILLIALLKAVGIDATEVMVQTRLSNNAALLSSKKVAVPAFDHGIAFLPGQGGAPGIWLDATGQDSRLGPLPSMDARASAFFVDLGPPEIQASPSGSAADNAFLTQWTITLSAAGGGELVADEHRIGDYAHYQRTEMAKPDTRQQSVEGLIATYFPTVQVLPPIDFEPELKDGATRLRYRAHLEGLARHEERDLIVPVGATTTLTARFAPLLTRTLPVVLPSRLAPSQQVLNIRIVAPVGFRPGVLPVGGSEEGGEFGSASLQISKDPADPRSVLVTRKLTIDKSTIPAAQYAAWRSFLQRVDALLRRSIRFVPAEGGVR